MAWSSVIYSEEVMREGFGIEDARIKLDDRIALLDALSATGLQRITLGAFVSPRFVPQMACFEELLRRVSPPPGVLYLPFVHNAKARAMAARFSPPLTLEDEDCILFYDICDVHGRRNVNRSLDEIIARWPDAIADAKARGIRTGRVAIGSAWGSNFMGKFPQDYRLAMLARGIDALTSAGIEIIEIGLHDSQSFCLPHEMEADLLEIRRRWPSVRRLHLHMHDARGMALPSIYAALRTLDETCTVLIDGTLGGIGGGQYGGNGRASAMAATEDLIHMLDGMGIPTGIDLGRIIDCVWLLERIIGRPAFGHVAKAGPRPEQPSAYYDPNMPGIESLEAARHFRLGPAAYANEGLRPWKQPITGPFHPVTAQ